MGGATGGDGGNGDSDDHVVDMMMWFWMVGCVWVWWGGAELPSAGYMCHSYFTSVKYNSQSATMLTRHYGRLTASPGSLQSLGNSACLPSVSSPTRQTLLCCRNHSPAGCGIR